MSSLDEIFGDGSGIKDLKEFEKMGEDLKKLRRIGGFKAKKGKWEMRDGNKK